MSSTLLQYLTEPNPQLNRDRALQGLPTRCDLDEAVRIAEWSDFTYQNLMSCYGDFLQRQHDPLPGISPRLKPLECQIFDEDSFDHLLSRTVIPVVSQSLSVAWDMCYPNHSGKKIDITRGGRARKTLNESASGTQGTSTSRHTQTKIFPDWAGVLESENPIYTNRCPGETKLATKWTSGGARSENYYWPIAQVLGYCVKNWKTRYGYIITEEELVVVRFSREKIGSGLAMERSPRAPRPGAPAAESSGQHQRNDSIASSMSGISSHQVAGHSRESSRSSNNGAMSIGGQSAIQSSPAAQHQRQHSIASRMSSMSIEQSSVRSRESSVSSGNVMRSVGEQSYEEGSSGGEYRPIEMKSIPWSNQGQGKLTVKLALWWIHMLAAAPGCETKVDNHYDHLDTWVPSNGAFQHISTGFVSKSQPKTGHIGSSHRPSTPPRNPQSKSSPFSSPLSSPPSSMVISSSPPNVNRALPDIESVLELRWDENRRQWRFGTNTGNSGNFPRGTSLWSSQKGQWFRPELGERGKVEWVPDTRSVRPTGVSRSNRGSDEGSDRSSGSSKSSKGKGVAHDYRKQRK